VSSIILGILTQQQHTRTYETTELAIMRPRNLLRANKVNSVV